MTKRKYTTLNWKHTTKNHKAYGEWDGSKYETPFMVLDEECFEDDESD